MQILRMSLITSAIAARKSVVPRSFSVVSSTAEASSEETLDSCSLSATGLISMV